MTIVLSMLQNVKEVARIAKKYLQQFKQFQLEFSKWNKKNEITQLNNLIKKKYEGKRSFAIQRHQ